MIYLIIRLNLGNLNHQEAISLFLKLDVDLILEKNSLLTD